MCANFISLIIDLGRIIFRPWSVALETSISSAEVLNTALKKVQRIRIFLSVEPQNPEPTFAQIQSLCTLGCSKARWSLGTLNCIDTRLPLKVNQPWNMNTVRCDLAVTSIPAESLESCRGHGSSNYFPHTASSSSFQYQTNRRQTCTNQRGELICQHYTLVLAIIRNQRYRNEETELWQKTGYIFNISIFIFPFLASEAIFVENIYPLECTDSTCWASIHFLASSTEENSTNAKPRDAPILPRGKKYTRCVNFGWYKFH